MWEKISAYWYSQSGTSLGVSRRCNTNIVLVAHRIITNGSLRRYVYKPFSSSPLGEVVYVARLETISRRALSPQGLHLLKSPSWSLLHLIRVRLHKDSTSTRKLSSSQLLQLWIAHHMVISYYYSSISGIYFPNIVIRRSRLNILTRISILHLYKGRSPILLRYNNLTLKYVHL